MGKMVGLVGIYIYVYIYICIYIYIYIHTYLHNPGECCVDMISPPR